MSYHVYNEKKAHLRATEGSCQTYATGWAVRGLGHTQRYQGYTRLFAKENLEFLIEEK